MRDTTIARNYAEALLALARKAGAPEQFGALIDGVSEAMEREPRLGNFLASPQVSAVAKKAILGKAFGPVLPGTLVRFLQKLVDNRRQLLIPAIAVEYGNLLDESTGRVHALVTVSREITAKDEETIAARLTERLGRVVVPHVSVNPGIIGGVIVRVGDTVMDGSVRRRLATLRSRLTSTARQG